ncbi:MAG: hypothetical protein IT355_04365 [Gemmatimonadaceae bacterium]|nr:hypothetical protein [Gemmatimonadaceae bacterium]
MIHGRSQGGKIANELKATWTKTLQEGFSACNATWPQTVQVDFPYYADLLDDFAARAGLPSTGDVAAKGPGQNVKYEQFMQSALDELQANAEISDAEVQAQVPDGVPQQKGPQNWWWVQAIARAIDNRLEGVTSVTIETFLKDVFVYVSAPAVAKAVNAIVEKEITTEPTIVIGHSLGSVVAYNVLVKHAPNMALKKFITVGSPLGLRVISSKLGLLSNPAGAGGWYNAYDDRDVVALNPLDDEYFPTTPGIENSRHVRNSTSNRHGIIGYLNDAAVAKQVADALC